MSDNLNTIIVSAINNDLVPLKSVIEELLEKY